MGTHAGLLGQNQIGVKIFLICIPFCLIVGGFLMAPVLFVYEARNIAGVFVFPIFAALSDTIPFLAVVLDVLGDPVEYDGDLFRIGLAVLCEFQCLFAGFRCVVEIDQIRGEQSYVVRVFNLGIEPGDQAGASE